VRGRWVRRRTTGCAVCGCVQQIGTDEAMLLLKCWIVLGVAAPRVLRVMVVVCPLRLGLLSVFVVKVAENKGYRVSDKSNEMEPTK
jgi:hypothetical protein